MLYNLLLHTTMLVCVSPLALLRNTMCTSLDQGLSVEYSSVTRYSLWRYLKKRDKILAIHTQWKTMFVVYLPRSVGILRRRLGRTFYRHHLWHSCPAGDFETDNFISCPNMLHMIEKYVSNLFPNWSEELPTFLNLAECQTFPCDILHRCSWKVGGGLQWPWQPHFWTILDQRLTIWYTKWVKWHWL